MNLSCNRIGNEGAIAIAHAVQSIQGFKLYLWCNCITEIKCIHVDFHSFAVLSIGISDSGAVSLTDSLNRTSEERVQKCHVFSLRECRLSLYSLNLLLTVQLCFKTLDINHVNIGVNGAKVLAKALAPSMLSSLDISFCGIGKDGAATLFQSLNRSIHELIATANNIQDSGASALHG